MTEIDYTNLIESLKSIVRGNSELANRQGMEKALQLISESPLDEDSKTSLRKTICKAANPSGWYFDSNGTNEAINALEMLRANISDSKPLNEAQAPMPLKSNRGQTEDNTRSLKAFNRRNLKNLVSDGKIFSIEFIKRSTGELRTMTARSGVKKHLKGGLKAYNPAQHNLLTVFDMDAKGYRSIPVEAVQRLSIGGQTFNFAGV